MTLDKTRDLSVRLLEAKIPHMIGMHHDSSHVGIEDGLTITVTVVTGLTNAQLARLAELGFSFGNGVFTADISTYKEIR